MNLKPLIIVSKEDKENSIFGLSNINNKLFLDICELKDFFSLEALSKKKYNNNEVTTQDKKNDSLSLTNYIENQNKYATTCKFHIFIMYYRCFMQKI